jgi:hypothetical protein
MLPTLEESQARIAIGFFRMLAEGEPVSHERRAERLILPVDEVSATLAALPAIFHGRGGTDLVCDTSSAAGTSRVTTTRARNNLPRCVW